jgi:sulfate-transporting ATPase
MISEIFLFAILGAATGSLIALSSLGMVLTYRGSGVLNFASGAMGMVGTFAYWELHDANHVWMPIAMIAGIAVSALLGYITSLLIRPLEHASTLMRVVVTLTLLVGIEGIMEIHFPFSNNYLASPIFPSGGLSIFGTIIPSAQLYVIGTGVVLTAILYWVYHATPFGRATSAAAENSAGLATLGWNPRIVASGNWALGGALAGFAGIMLAPITGVSVQLATLLLLPGLAAAVVGNLSSFPITLVGAMLIGVGESEITRWVNVPSIADLIPLVAIFGVVILRGSAIPLRSAVAERLPRVSTGAIHWRPLIIFTAVAALVLNLALSTEWVNAVTYMMMAAIMLFSIIVVTGFAGQISLAQWALAGFGALVMARLRVAGLPFAAAIPVAIVLTIPVGFIVGIAALRARGMSLAIATLAFGSCVVDLVLGNNSLIGGGAGLAIGPFELFGLRLDPLDHPQRYSLFVLLSLVCVGLVLLNIRRGKAGRRLLAIRANERAAAALGLDVMRGKLVAFCYGSAIAAFGGILFTLVFPTAIFTVFDSFTSIQLVSNSVLGGVGYVTGAIAGGQGQTGGVFSVLLGRLGGNNAQYLAPIFALLTLSVIIRAPDGLIQLNVDDMRRLRKRLTKKSVRPPAPIVLPDSQVATSVARSLDSCLLEVDGISVRLGGTQAVDNVSFTLSSGEVLGVIGPNGAGKTTLIDALTGFVRVQSGTIRLDGTTLNKLPTRRRASAGVGRSFQSLELFEDMTVYENLLAACEDQDWWSWIRDLIHPGRPQLSEVAVAAVREFGLEMSLARLPKDLSLADRRLVAIARTISANPKVLLLDEPAAGLDERSRRELVSLVRRLATEWNMAVLLIEHDVALVASASDRVLAMDFGRRVALGGSDEVRNNPAVLASYLGIVPSEDETDVSTAGDTAVGSGQSRSLR